MNCFEGRGGFRPLFFSRTYGEEYRQTPSADPLIWDPKISASLDCLTLDDSQIARYHDQYLLLGDAVLQEYPCVPEDAFLQDARLVLSQAVLSNIVTPDYEPDTMYPELRLYRKPLASLTIGVDTSLGVSDGDRSAISVRGYEGELVAFWRDRVSPDQIVLVLERLMELGYLGTVAIERNNTGLVTLDRARDCRRSSRLYHEEEFDAITRHTVRKLGRCTTAKTRPLLFARREEARRKGWLVEADERVVEEMRTLVYRHGRPEAKVGCHDDGIIAEGIAWMVRG